MIKQLKIKNFKSIKDELVISLVKNKLTDNTYYKNYFSFGEEEILKVIAFYGMNASGKTNIVVALAALRALVVPTMQANSQGNIEVVLPYFPFSFSNETKEKPIEFEITFSLNNEDSVLYKYYVSYVSKRIVEERFEKQTSQKFSLIYNRRTNENNITSINFGTSVSNQALLKALENSIVPNTTFLSMFSTFNVEDFYNAYTFFSKRIINITPEISRYSDYMPSKVIADEKLREFTLKLLQAADFNVKGMHVVETNKIRGIVINPFGQKVETKQLILEHDGKDVDDGNMEFINESLGTKKIMLLAEFLYNAFSTSTVMVVDELEASLHPELTEFIIKCFLDETINTHNSQLIFTSHESTLLDLDLLRRDQIYFVYKDVNTCGTYVRCLKDFRVRSSDSVAKSYLAGRYLTSPNINEGAIKREY